MLRHILHDIELAIIFAIATLLFWIVISLMTVEPAIAQSQFARIATITETDISPGLIHCRAEQILTDEAGQKWEIMLFANQVDFPQTASLTLRLSGLSGSARIQPQKPLIISSDSREFAKSSTKPHLYEAPNTFLGEAPLPSIGQYDLHQIVLQLPTEGLILEIPLENARSSRLHIPQTMVLEWQEVAAKSNQNQPIQKLPSGFQLFC